MWNFKLLCAAHCPWDECLRNQLTGVEVVLILCWGYGLADSVWILVWTDLVSIWFCLVWFWLIQFRSDRDWSGLDQFWLIGSLILTPDWDGLNSVQICLIWWGSNGLKAAQAKFLPQEAAVCWWNPSSIMWIHRLRHLQFRGHLNNACREFVVLIKNTIMFALASRK